MKTIIHFIRRFILTVLVLAGFITSARAQEVSIPDPGLNAAIREALQKPNGPLTEQDLLSLINLDGRNRNISGVGNSCGFLLVSVSCDAILGAVAASRGA